KQIVGHQDANLALEAFHWHDRIASHQEVYSPEDVMAGLEIAAQLKHPGLRAYFLGLHAPLLELRGEMPEAKAMTLEAVDILITLLEADSVYVEQTLKTLFIATMFSAANGDFPEARHLLNLQHAIGGGRMPSPLDQILRSPPRFKSDPREMMNTVNQ